MLKYLPSLYKTFILDYGVRFQEERITDAIVHYTIPREKLPLMLGQWFSFLNGKRLFYQAATALLCKPDSLYLKILDHCAGQSSVLIAEFPYQFFTIRKYQDKLLVYSAHNVESSVQDYVLPDTLFGRITKAYIRYLERKACQDAHVVIACSESDRRKLCSLYKISDNKVFVVPNGADLEEIQPAAACEKEAMKKVCDLNGKKIILFIGSWYLPNVEAVRFIADALAPALRDFIFLVAGDAVRRFFENVTLFEYQRLFHISRLRDNGGATYGCGWHFLEEWPEGFRVRWTRKKCDVLLPHDASGIYFKAMCPKSIPGEVFVNGKKIGSFQTSKRWATFEYRFDTVQNPVMEIGLPRLWKPLRDSRRLGIAVQEVGYFSGNKRQKVSLDTLQMPAFSVPGSENIIFMYDVDDETRRMLFKMSDVAINPMFHGSGTNLKMFEYMAAGLPVVTTPVGARGIDAESGRHFLQCEHGEFAANITRLFQDSDLYGHVRKNARRLVEEKYDWRIISARCARIIREKLQERKKSDENSSLP